MDRQLTQEVARECASHKGNPGAKLHRAIQLFNFMRNEGVDFATMADAFTILASWNQHRVFVDESMWIPPLFQGDVQCERGTIG